MVRRMWRALAGGLALLGLLACGDGPGPGPIYLTWSRDDTSRSMTVHYHGEASSRVAEVRYDRVPRGGDPEAYALRASGFVRVLEGVERTVHIVELRDLEPGGVYYFVVGDEASGFSPERSFRTVPEDDAPLTFVAGADMSTGYLPRMISRQAAAQSPSFALLGGDLAYGRALPRDWEEWRDWFADWEATMHTPEGHLIPMVVAVGNHETDSGQPKGASPEQRAPAYLGFFYQNPEGRSYFHRRFGRRMSLVVLDSGHLARHDGEQLRWLEEVMRAERAPFRFALYHVGLYPAHYPWDQWGAVAGRRYWLPVFDAFGLTAAFEGHGHVQKRTVPLRGGVRVAPEEGVLYLGDGCWGKSHIHDPDPERWYLATALKRRHVWRVTVMEHEVRYTALGANGQVIDATTQRPRTAAPGAAP